MLIAESLIRPNAPQHGRKNAEQGQKFRHICIRMLLQLRPHACEMSLEAEEKEPFESESSIQKLKIHQKRSCLAPGAGPSPRLMLAVVLQTGRPFPSSEE